MKTSHPKEKVNMETGEVSEGKLNEVIVHTTVRPNGSLRIQQDFSNCPTLTEQHTAHVTNLNYLIEKYKPDELAAYIAARNQYRQEIIGHDFSQEPDLQEGMNVVYRMKQAFEAMPEDFKNQFKNHVEFLKYIDNPENQKKLLKLGVVNKDQLERLSGEEHAPAEPSQNKKEKNSSSSSAEKRQE